MADKNSARMAFNKAMTPKKQVIEASSTNKKGPYKFTIMPDREDRLNLDTLIIQLTQATGLTITKKSLIFTLIAMARDDITLRDQLADEFIKKNR